MSAESSAKIIRKMGNDNNGRPELTDQLASNIDGATKAFDDFRRCIIELQKKYRQAGYDIREWSE